MTQALPLISDAIRVLEDTVAFTMLETKNGYWQITLDPDSRNCTAFAAPDGGTYRFRVMPFGLKTSTNHFCIVERVMYEFHDTGLSGHPGQDETLRAIQERFSWEGMQRDIRDYVRSCIICASCKSFRTGGREQQRPRQPQNPWEVVALNLMALNLI